MIHRVPRYLLSKRLYLLLIVHACLAAVCYWLAFQLRFDFNVETRYAAILRSSVPWVVAVKLAAFYQFGSFHGWWRHVTFEDLTALLRVARLVKSAHSIEQNLGALLSKPTVLALGQSISQIIVEELEGIDDYEAIVDRINHRIVEAIVTAGSTSAN